jgi:hypothetical protein
MIFVTQHCHIRNRTLIGQGKTIYANSIGTFDDFLTGAFQKVAPAYARFYKMDHLSKLGFLAAEVLLKDVKLLNRYTPEQVSLVLSNAHASLDSDVRYLESVKNIPSPALFVYTLPNIVAGEICIRHGIKGENAFFVFPEFDAVQLSEYVSMVMGSEKTQACVAGWVEVMGDQHDVFLYLAEKRGAGGAVEHTAGQLDQLYKLSYGTVDVGS